VNETLHQLKADNKINIMIFNKIDLYRARYFDAHLPSDVKSEIIGDLQQSWMAKSNNNAIFISAETGENIDELRKLIYKNVKTLYLQRYPYKASYLESYDQSLE
jgi:GTP-binding protein HflX